MSKGKLLTQVEIQEQIKEIRSKLYQISKLAVPNEDGGIPFWDIYIKIANAHGVLMMDLLASVDEAEKAVHGELPF
jgi:hypothetical protein